MAKQSLLQKFGRLSEAKKLLVFLLTFAIIGGGYMAYKSFAATPANYSDWTKISGPCFSFKAPKNTKISSIGCERSVMTKTGSKPFNLWIDDGIFLVQRSNSIYTDLPQVASSMGWKILDYQKFIDMWRNHECGGNNTCKGEIIVDKEILVDGIQAHKLVNEFRDMGMKKQEAIILVNIGSTPIPSIPSSTCTITPNEDCRLDYLLKISMGYGGEGYNPIQDLDQVLKTWKWVR